MKYASNYHYFKRNRKKDLQNIRNRVKRQQKEKKECLNLSIIEYTCCFDAAFYVLPLVKKLIETQKPKKKEYCSFR